MEVWSGKNIWKVGKMWEKYRHTVIILHNSLHSKESILSSATWW